MTGLERASVNKVESGLNFQSAIKRAAACILAGGIVAVPTETFYGLAVDSTNERAIQKLIEVKNRGKVPILILLSGFEELDRYVSRVSREARKLIQAFWPGPLTLVFEAQSGISPLLTAGTGKIGIRFSSHPVATNLARVASRPITGTSANVSGKPACRDPREVLKSLGEKIDLLLDGGKVPGELGSTVLDTTVTPPRMIREGAVPLSDLKRVISL